MKKLSLIGVGALVVALGLAACEPSVTTTTSGTNTDPTTTTSQEPAKNVTITFWHTFGQSIVETLTEKIQEFHDLVLENENVNVTIELSYSGSYDDILTKINNGFSAGNIPTIAVAYPDHVADYLSRETYDGQYVVNLEPYINNEEYGFNTQPYLGDEEGLDDFIESYYEEGTAYAKEGVFSLPLMKSSEVMFYNENIISLALTGNSRFTGYKPTPDFVPTEENIRNYMENLTWDEFMNFCQFINNNKSYFANTIEYPAYYDSDGNLFITKMYQNNIPYASVDENGSGVIEFESGTARTQAEQLIADINAEHEAGLFTTKGVEGTYGSNNFTEVKSVFSIGSSGGTGYTVPTSGTFNVRAVKVPYDNDNPIYVSQGPTLCIMNNPRYSQEENSLRQEYAWRFIKYLTNAEVNVELCIRGSNGYVPVRYSAYESEDFTSFLLGGDIYAETASVILDDIRNEFIVTPVFKGSAELREQGGSIITSVFTDQKTNITQAFDDAINETKIAMS